MKFKYLSAAEVKNMRAIGRAKTRKELLRHVVVEKVEPYATIKEIKEARKALGLSRKSFAEIFGMSKRTVEAWEQGLRSPDTLATKNIRMIAKNPSFAEELKAA